MLHSLAFKLFNQTAVSVSGKLYDVVLDRYLVFFLKWLFFDFLTFVKYSDYAIPKNNTYIIIL